MPAANGDTVRSGQADGDSGQADMAGGIEFLRCPECGRRFWADPGAGAGGRCVVGIVPAPVSTIVTATGIPGARP